MINLLNKMKKFSIFNFHSLFFLIILIYFTSVECISINTNKKFLSLIDNYINRNNNNLQSQFLQINNNNSTNVTINHSEIDKLNTKNNFNFNPFFDVALEDMHMISSNFLGTVIPNSNKNETEKFDCSNFNITNENYLQYRKLCNDTNLIQLRLKSNNRLKLFNSQNILECNNNTCKSSQGKCININKCQCESGFVDDPNLSINLYCSYKQKSQLNFFLTEFFVPIGIGHILNGRIFYGLIKCSVVVGLFMIDLISKCVLLCGKERGAKFPNYITFFYFAIFVFWQAYDITMIGFNKFKEENNVPYIQVEI